MFLTSDKIDWATIASPAAESNLYLNSAIIASSDDSVLVQTATNPLSRPSLCFVQARISYHTNSATGSRRIFIQKAGDTLSFGCSVPQAANHWGSASASGFLIAVPAEGVIEIYGGQSSGADVAVGVTGRAYWF